MIAFAIPRQLTPKEEALKFENDPYAMYYRRGASQQFWRSTGVGTTLAAANLQTGRVVSRRGAGALSRRKIRGFPMPPIIVDDLLGVSPSKRFISIGLAVAEADFEAAVTRSLVAVSDDMAAGFEV